MKRSYNATILIALGLCAVAFAGPVAYSFGHAWLFPLMVVPWSVAVWPIYVTDKRVARTLLGDAQMMAKLMEEPESAASST